MNKSKMPGPCDCGNTVGYERCCAPYIDGGQGPEDAERLMRSRYTAYVRCRQDYLLKTWHPDTRPGGLAFDERLRWLGLKVLAFTETAANTAEVEFVARSKLEGAPAQRLHERSRFARVDGNWLYIDGQIKPPKAMKRAG